MLTLMISLSPHLAPSCRLYTTFVAFQEDFGTLGNNFLGAPPNHSVICLALRLCTEAVNRGDTDFLWLSTGPGLLSRGFRPIRLSFEQLRIPTTSGNNLRHGIS